MKREGEMMKIFSCGQIRGLDAETILNEPISSVDLMERAASKIAEWIVQSFDSDTPIYLFSGPGNNGGDGLVVARLLIQKGFSVETFVLAITDSLSDDCAFNLRRLEDECAVKPILISNESHLPTIPEGAVVVDAIFGSGLSRAVANLPAKVIAHINSSEAKIVSVDIPSGLFGEDNSHNDLSTIIHADYTLSFQFPKLSFMFADNYKYIGEQIIVPIGLDEGAIERTTSPYMLIDSDMVKSLLQKRGKFDHKGTFGHALFVGGSYGKMGAVTMGAKAALRGGAGLVTCYVPRCGVDILQVSVPQAMALCCDDDESLDVDSFTAVGVGPGMGRSQESVSTVNYLLEESHRPMVLDADALNIISENKEWLDKVTRGSILTPHPKEFERLFGKTDDGYSRLQLQVNMSREHGFIIILKGANTSVSMPDGRVFFNTTGNPGMATGGSGDVLTGLLIALLAQGYSSENAAIVGVYIHGLAGDIAADKWGEEAMMATDIIDGFGDAFKAIRGVCQ